MTCNYAVLIKKLEHVIFILLIVHEYTYNVIELIVLFCLDIIPSASEPNELTIFKENYASLCNTITDINELLKYFVAEKIITMNQQEEITACITRSERVSKLLLNISGPLEAGNSKGFYTMLKIMKTHGVDATQCLASHIVAKVENLKSYQQVDTRIMPLGWTQGLLRLHCQDCMYVIVVTWARGICLICMPEARRPEG